MAKASCDSCVYNVYDEDDETYYCEVDMDEDDAARLWISVPEEAGLTDQIN